MQPGIIMKIRPHNWDNPTAGSGVTMETARREDEARATSHSILLEDNGANDKMRRRRAGLAEIEVEKQISPLRCSQKREQLRSK